MAKDKTYFVAHGRSLEIIEAYQVAVKAHINHSSKVGERLEANGCFRYSDNSFAGFSFDLDVELPPGLRRDKNNRKMVVPNLRLKASKAFRDEIALRPCPGHWTITRDLWEARLPSDRTLMAPGCSWA